MTIDSYRSHLPHNTISKECYRRINSYTSAVRVILGSTLQKLYGSEVCGAWFNRQNHRIICSSFASSLTITFLLYRLRTWIYLCPFQELMWMAPYHSSSATQGWSLPNMLTHSYILCCCKHCHHTMLTVFDKFLHHLCLHPTKIELLYAALRS
jgi:hypothetical protein